MIYYLHWMFRFQILSFWKLCLISKNQRYTGCPIQCTLTTFKILAYILHVAYLNRTCWKYKNISIQNYPLRIPTNLEIFINKEVNLSGKFSIRYIEDKYYVEVPNVEETRTLWKAWEEGVQTETTNRINFHHGLIRTSVLYNSATSYRVSMTLRHGRSSKHKLASRDWAGALTYSPKHQVPSYEYTWRLMAAENIPRHIYQDIE